MSLDLARTPDCFSVYEGNAMATRRMRAAVAVVAGLALVMNNIPIFAASLEGRTKATAPPTSPTRGSLERLDSNGRVIPMPAEALTRKSATKRTTAVPVSVEEMRRQVFNLKMNGVATDKQIAQLELWIDIAAAKTRAERHEKILKLPVKIVVSSPTDGRVGVIKSFVAGGRTHARLFIPAPEATSMPDEQSSGPAVSESPVAQDQCYDDDGTPDTCATEQDAEDLIAVASDTEAEAEGYQAEADGWCQQTGCDDSDPATGSAYGPFEPDMRACGRKFLTWALYFGGFAAAYVNAFGVAGAIAGGAAVGAGTVFVAGVGLVVAIGFAGLALYDLASCAKMQEPTLDVDVPQLGLALAQFAW